MTRTLRVVALPLCTLALLMGGAPDAASRSEGSAANSEGSAASSEGSAASSEGSAASSEGSAASSEGSELRRDVPDILLLLADDQSHFDLRCCGNPLVETPTLDALRQEGMRFTHAFTPTPTCVPSRAILMTGLYPQQNGVVGFARGRDRVRDDVATLPELLSRAGYRTGLVGKRHLRPSARYPFDFRSSRGDEDKQPDALRGQVSAFLAADDPRPFFLMVAFRDAHRPFPRPAPETPEEVLVPGHLPDIPGVREDLLHYASALKRLDFGVRAVLEALDASGRAGQTLVLYTADHGHSFPFAKATLYDAGVRVPLLVRWPGRVAVDTDTPVVASFIDLVPTLLDAAGRGDLVPADAAGRSLLATLRGDPSTLRERIFLSQDDTIEGNFPSRAVRTEAYKYIYNPHVDRPFENESQLGLAWRSMLEQAAQEPRIAARVAAYLHRPREELFSLESDPDERTNRADDPSLRAVRDELRAALAAWMRAHSDPLAERFAEDLRSLDATPRAEPGRAGGRSLQRGEEGRGMRASSRIGE